MVRSEMAFELVCTVCGFRHDGSRYRLHCDRCTGLLDIEYDLPPGTGARTVPGLPGLCRYAPMLPIKDPAGFVTLGEGNTPVIPLHGVGRDLDLRLLFAKLEYFNPTCSFKDRGNAIQVTVLKDLGITAAVDIAGGNAGHSLASYCARAGLKFIGFGYEDPQSPKIRAIEQTGAEIHWIEGDRRDCSEAMAEFCAANGILNLRYSQSAYFIEGQKTIAYEIAEQLDPLPDHIMAPVGNGSILLGLWKGFREMVEDGRIQAIPRLHAVQSEAFRPLVAVIEGYDWRPSLHADTVAVGIRISEPPRLAALASACQGSGGTAVAVPEASILRWYRRLASSDGIFVEPTSATVIAGTATLIQRGRIDKGDRVLTILTGYGLKEPIPESAATAN